MTIEFQVEIKYNAIKDILAKVPADKQKEFRCCVEQIIRCLSDDCDSLSERCRECSYTLHHYIKPLADFSEGDINRIVKFTDEKAKALKKILGSSQILQL